MLRIVNLTADQQQILNRLSSWGGVLDFGFFATSNGPEPTEDSHREAVKLTMSQLRTNFESYIDRTSIDRGIDRSKFFAIKFEDESVSALIPTKISWKQFLGTRYDFQRQGLLVQGNEKYLNELFFYEDEELK